jgi:hypothetical protein
MQLADKIEKRRFIGREFLLWLWFESELFTETLSTEKHGDFGFWIEKEIVLSSGKEVTRIKGTTPAHAREAKEGLRLGKMPERATFRLVLGERESGFSLKAEALAIGGLSLPAVLDDGSGISLGELGSEMMARPKKKKGSAEDDERRESDGKAEAFYDRMDLTQEVESILEGLYRDFLTLRLGKAWDSLLVPALKAWLAGDELDDESYRTNRYKALGRKAPPR